MSRRPDPKSPAVPVATLGQGDGPQVQSPRRGRKGNASQDGKPVQLALFDGLGPVMPAKLSAHPLYGVWANMKTRCNNPKSPAFKDYGGRGIVVCEEWRNSPMAFIAWALANGWRPGLQLDRRDNDGPYSPGNCRFVTRKQNMANRRNTLRLSDGRAAVAVAEANGLSSDTLYDRIWRGWTAEQAVGIAPPPPTICLQPGVRVALSDGRPAWRAAKANGVVRGTFWSRLSRGWTPDQAAGIAPPPQRRQNGAGQAQRPSDVGRGRESRKAAGAYSPGRGPRGDERNGHA